MRVAALLCIVALCASARPAAAADPPLSTQAAQAHYEAGSVYYEKGEYRRAADEFVAAQRDDDRPALDYNLGVCWEKLGDAARATASYRRFVERQPGNDRRAEIAEKIRQLDALVGVLVVHSTVAGARLTVDDVVVEIDAPVRVNVGRRRVTAAREGYLPRTVEVDVVAGARARADVDPTPPRRTRRRDLAIGLGVAGGVIVVGTAVTLGVVFGVRAFQPHETELGTITVGK